MNQLILTPFFLVSLSLSVSAQKDSTKIKTKPLPMQYCATLKDGELVIMTDEHEITSDVITEDGTIIKSNGNIVKRDGTSTELKEGECISTQGIFVNRPSLKNTDKTENKKTEVQFSDLK
jgi:hypothetical protein